MSVFIFQPFWLQHPKKRFTSPLPGELVAFLLAKGVGIPWPHAVERTWVAKDAGGERTWVARFVRTNLDCKECVVGEEGTDVGRLFSASSQSELFSCDCVGGGNFGTGS